MKYKVSQFARMHNVSTRTVWNWYYKGIVKTERDNTNHLWIIEDEDKPIDPPKVAVYARVSSSENKNNLDTQAERIVSYCNAKGWKVDKIVKEVGSGMNDKRTKLQALLEDDSFKTIVVEHKDRLTRFGFNYIETLLKRNQRKIEVINCANGDDNDIIQDFVSVITSFCARIYGKRWAKRKTELIINELNKKDDATD